MVMRVQAFPRPARPPGPMFRGVMPPPPPPPPRGGPFGQFPPGPPCFPPGGRLPLPPGGPFRGADHMRPMRPSLRMFGPPPPPPTPPPAFIRGGPGVMRSRPLFRPPKYNPYPVNAKGRNGPASAGSANAGNGATNIVVKPDPDAVNLTPASDGTSQTATTANGTTASPPAATSVQGTSATSANSNSAVNAKNGLAQAIEAAKRDGIPVDMIQALYCKLCDAKLNGSLQATAHYVGKSHAKRVKQYQHGQGRVGQQRLNAAAAAGGDASKGAATEGGKRPVPDTLEKFCKLCDVAFTSEIQAKQHYDGRNHQRRMRGEPPLPKGFYNPATGRWQRQPPPGMAIKSPPPKKPPPAPGSQFYCEPCHSSLTSEQQLQSHLQGAKHKARVGGITTAVTAQVVTANAAAALAAATGSVAGGRLSQLPQPYVAFVPGPTMTCGTC